MPESKFVYPVIRQHHEEMSAVLIQPLPSLPNRLPAAVNLDSLYLDRSIRQKCTRYAYFHIAFKKMILGL
jgi:hypothetical protein